MLACTRSSWTCCRCHTIEKETDAWTASWNWLMNSCNRFVWAIHKTSIYCTPTWIYFSTRRYTITQWYIIIKIFDFIIFMMNCVDSGCANRVRDIQRQPCAVQRDWRRRRWQSRPAFHTLHRVTGQTGRIPGVFPNYSRLLFAGIWVYFRGRDRRIRPRTGELLLRRQHEATARSGSGRSCRYTETAVYKKITGYGHARSKFKILLNASRSTLYLYTFCSKLWNETI